MSLVYVRATTLCTIGALIASATLLPAPVFAGPDDGKFVATRTHVDAPKVFYTGGANSFELRTNTGPIPLVEDSVIWVGKGWNKESIPTYQFKLPETGFDWLGKPGDIVYSTPQVADSNKDPVWWGFGADESLPSEDFRGRTTSLDLVSVDGPGEMHLFSYQDVEEPPRLLLGTTNDAPKSTPLTKGSHTHNYTAFTKPGRYELTYRASARTNDGRFVASKPQVLAVQVGGQKPAEQAASSLKDRYSAASTGDTTGYTLSLAPHTGRDRGGDENLTDITFHAPGSDVTGTLTLLIDGYFLTDLPVTNGEATWAELLGSRASQIQAVFTPTGKGARWISAPVAYNPGEAKSTKESSTTWQDGTNLRTFFPGAKEPTNDPARVLSEPGFDFSVSSRDEDYSTLEFTADDTNLRGVLTALWYTNESDKEPANYNQLLVENGKAKEDTYDGGLLDGNRLVIEFSPHPEYAAQPQKIYHKVLTEDFKSAEGIHLHDYLPTTSGKKPSPEDSATVVTPIETVDMPPATETTRPNRESEQGKPKKSGNNRPPQLDTLKYLLNAGHVDITATGGRDGLGVTVKDETGEYAKSTVERTPDQVALGVGDNAHIKRSRYLTGSDFDFLGTDKFYLLPETQNRYIVWPGYDTQRLNYSDFSGDVRFEVNPVSVPEGAQWGAWTNPMLGGSATLVLNSAKGDAIIDTGFARHQHLNWGFSKPGIYQFEVKFTADKQDGGVTKPVPTTPQILTFAIGTATRDELAKHIAASPATPEPQDIPVPDRPTGQPQVSGGDIEPWKIAVPLTIVGILGIVAGVFVAFHQHLLMIPGPIGKHIQRILGS